jgi:hypothetical protein
MKLWIVQMDYTAWPKRDTEGPQEPWKYYVLAEDVEEAAKKVIEDRRRRAEFMFVPGGDAKVLNVEEFREVII